VSSDAMEMFGVLDLEAGFEGCRFAIGIRNANNKRFRLACTVGLRVFVCQNLAFRGDYTPVLAKHSKHFSLEDALSIGVDRMQRNFDPMRQQVERWRVQQLSGEVARLMIYRAFIEGELEVPKHLARRVHELYFNPEHEEFQPRTMWSLSNAFTSAFKELDPIPQFRATAKLGSFLEAATAARSCPDTSSVSAGTVRSFGCAQDRLPDTGSSALIEGHPPLRGPVQEHSHA
jgi:hypothetical protein